MVGDEDDDVLRCDGLSLSFGERLAVDDLSFAVRRGETYGLLGPNGSGKTTTISMIAGILTPDRGSVVVSGLSISAGSRGGKSAIGLVPQEIALYEDLSATENLRFFGRLQGMSGSRLDTRVGEVLDVVGLADRADDRIGEYSGGMKRRANIAAGLLHEPELLILDEPTVGVDPQSRNQILESIEALGGEGLSVLYTTHYMEEAERLCDRIGILDRGRLIAEGTRRELVARIGEHDLIIFAGSISDDETAGDMGEEATELASSLGRIDQVVDVQVTSRGIEVLTDSATAVLPPAVGRLAESSFQIASIDVREPNLESVFLDLTGRALRD